MSVESADTAMPTVKIPAQPEVVMAGITHILVPTIMKCALGGWIVVIPGRGIAGKSELSEAIAFLEDQAFDIFQEPRIMPKFLEKPREHLPEDILEESAYRQIQVKLNGILGSVVAFFGTVGAFLGVRSLGH